MRFLKSIELNNYRNLRHAKLRDLKDLNIIIGPNNCGKTSFLRGINLLSKMTISRSNPSFWCKSCKEIFDFDQNTRNVVFQIDKRTKFLTKANVSALFQYDSSEIEKVLPEFNSEMINKIKDRALGKSDRGQVLKAHMTEELKNERLWIKEKANLNLRAEHISPLILEEVKTAMVDHIIFCPDERLQAYKGEKISEYVKNKNLTTSAQDRLNRFIRDVVDSKVLDSRHSLDLVREVEGQSFTTSIAEQGSGVRSLICLVADILSDRQAKILLIDEPELGLNPSCKHAFLKFLIEQTNSTHKYSLPHMTQHL